MTEVVGGCFYIESWLWGLAWTSPIFGKLLFFFTPEAQPGLLDKWHAAC